ncbi:hypothetical protein CNMCM5623_000880 [Aspergillus felis]|uniref:Phenylacetate-CoA ligase n=1 Tax=Aspergillus felis TaxID=1287682 RepID=A0A8H6Q865_9EURO|nr:hypothetical protein CNMCM5623_000880 [Aspergillus felis]KAF7178987.1 hypothetical protein CNMCM7691_007862 [Aspergillus felis]
MPPPLTETSNPPFTPVAVETTALQRHLDFVRKSSPYYRKLWENVPSGEQASLDVYPIVDHTSYWAGHGISRSEIITGSHDDGIILNTGGTTSHPKVTLISKDELRTTSYQLGLGILAAGIRPYDRVANLFYAGDLYGSFLLHILSIMDIGVPLVQLPIGGSCEPDKIIQHMRQLNATVVFATATTIYRLAKYLVAENNILSAVHRLMFSGEPFYEDQREVVARAFPSATIKSLVYGSIDAGVLGYSTPDEDLRIHVVNSPSVILEIVPDGSTTPTTRHGVSGSLLVTNMARKLQPVVRYPCGDKAEWVDYKNQTFRLLGRDRQTIRLGPVSIDFTDLHDIVASALPPRTLQALQAVITRECSIDQLTIRLVCENLAQDSTDTVRESIAKALDMRRPMFQDHVKRRLVNPLKVSIVSLEDFDINPRTGKQVQVVDKR